MYNLYSLFSNSNTTQQDDVITFFQSVNLDSLMNLYGSKGHPSLTLIIDQIGVDLHAQVTGDVYVWSHKYIKWYESDNMCGSHWERGGTWWTPQTWTSKWTALFAKSVVKDFSYFNEMNLKVPEDWDKLVKAALELYEAVTKKVFDEVHTFWFKMMRPPKAAFEVVVWNGVVQ